MAVIFLHLSEESTKMEPALRTTQVLKQEAEDIGLHGERYCRVCNKTLDREERAAWRDAAAQKLHAEEKKRADKIRMAETEAEDKKRADELQAEEKKRADEIKLQIAKIEAAKEQARLEAEQGLQA